MEIFEKLMEALGHTPAWVPLVLAPALLVFAAVLFTLFGGRKAYRYVAAVLGAAATALLFCMTPPGGAFFFLALFAALAALLCLLFFFPSLRRRQKTARGKRTDRAERIYERFREKLTETPDRPAAQPAKVCCFEEPPAEEAAPEPSYALRLLEKLQKEKLTPTDRLETDVLARTVSGLKGRALTEDEARTFNDCLASVRPFGGKYRLKTTAARPGARGGGLSPAAARVFQNFYLIMPRKYGIMEIRKMRYGSWNCGFCAIF